MTLPLAGLPATARPEPTVLAPRAFEPLPLGAVLPLGWLRDQLRVQADGLTGHLDEFWPSVADSRWIGGEHEGWERGPYWLDGLIPLAVLLGDERLMAKARRWIDYILAHQHEDGWLGPKDDPHAGTGETALDPWPQFVLFKALTQWQEATGDARVVPAMLRAAARLQALLAEKPLHSWAGMRWADLLLSLHWLFERTDAAWLLDLAATARAQGFDWIAHFDAFPYRQRTDPAWLAAETDEECLPLHGVNNAMGVKGGAVWSRQSGAPDQALSSLRAVAALDAYHGQVTGMFSGDEHLAGRDPSQGTETCTVAEYLFTLEQLVALTGEPALADRLERIAYNALPAALTKDMWARQYDQQPNQVLCSIHRRGWVSNGPHANLFSLEGNFGCCTANFHQGWPKFAAHLWMRTPDGGLAAVAYGPSRVTTRLGGVPVTVTEETEYPFRGTIRLAVRADAPVRFPLRLRIPAWAAGATVTVDGDGGPEREAAPGGFHSIDREWPAGETTVTLHLPLSLRRETRFNGAAALLRGPLVMALRIGEAFRPVGGQAPHADWEVHPTTPWNYGLLLADGGEAALRVQEAPLPRVPFDSAAPPVLVSAPVRRLPLWQMANGSAAPPPRSSSAGLAPPPAEEAALIPYGSTHLRISEFPVAPQAVTPRRRHPFRRAAAAAPGRETAAAPGERR